MHVRNPQAENHEDMETELTVKGVAEREGKLASNV